MEFLLLLLLFAQFFCVLCVGYVLYIEWDVVSQALGVILNALTEISSCYFAYYC